MGLGLYRVFQDAGLPVPKMHLEMPLGSDVDFIRLTSDLLCSLRPLAEQHKVSLKDLGDVDTLSERICAEVAAANTVVSLIAVVSDGRGSQPLHVRPAANGLIVTGNRRMKSWKADRFALP